MKHFLIFTNKNKDNDLKTTYIIKDYLENKGNKVSVYSDYDRAANLSNCFSDEIDVIIVLGGDGTVLQAVRAMKELDVPIIGVKLGTLGYMAEIEPSTIEASLDRLIRDDFILENRMMLEGRIVYYSEDTVISKDHRDEEKSCVTNLALNDIVITRNGPLQLMRFGIYVNGQFLTEYSGDGIIITTPTGSTGYNLSAGGPIIEPSASLLTVTPICPHSLNQRSVILSPDDLIEVNISEGHDGRTQIADINFDGADHFTVKTGDKIIIKKAEKVTKFIQLNQVSFLETLRNKLSIS